MLLLHREIQWLASASVISQSTAAQHQSLAAHVRACVQLFNPLERSEES